MARIDLKLEQKAETGLRSFTVSDEALFYYALLRGERDGVDYVDRIWRTPL